MTNPGSDKPVDLVDDVLDEIRSTMQRVKDRLRLQDLRLAERYVKGELHLLVEWRSGEIAEKYVAYLQRVSNPAGVVFECGHKIPLIASERLEHPVGSADVINTTKGSADYDQESVLVDIVQLVQKPEDFAAPTFVRFDSVDNFYRNWPRTLYLSGTLGCVFRGAIENRKGDRIHFSDTTTINPELHCDLVQSTSQVVDGVADNECYLKGRVGNLGQVVIGCPVLRIEFGPDFVRVGFQKAFEGKCEITDVLIGPFEFLPRIN